ncbi:DUF2513 domain-containing protein [Christensenellaceae bacterium OttesenSCG-928-M15]|nr:DUF2513 domain-containing protein [Christensenellaceae bacterium OttesenSCG-928-M15]
MRLNPDCIRGILLAVEEKELGSTYNVDTLHAKIPEFSVEEITYCCLKLDEAGLLQIMTIRALRQTHPAIKSIHELTMKGHDFLDNIRSESVWKETKSKATSVGSFALDVISQIASSIITARLGF